MKVLRSVLDQHQRLKVLRHSVGDGLRSRREAATRKHIADLLISVVTLRSPELLPISAELAAIMRAVVRVHRPEGPINGPEQQECLPRLAHRIGELSPGDDA